VSVLSFLTLAGLWGFVGIQDLRLSVQSRRDYGV
jgi:hypothetical protein